MMHKQEVDKGYAWVIVATSFFAHVIQYGVVWTVGIYYVVFSEVFEGSKAAISLISSLNTAVYYMTGPLASILTNHYGPRKVAMLGGLLGSFGLCISMFATNIYHLYVTFGFITGLGFGIAYIPSISIVGLYFEKRRTIALGLAVSGCGIGTFLFPPMLRLFINQYGWRGALLLTGGVCLNMCVCGALMRPLAPESPKSLDIKESHTEASQEKNGSLINTHKETEPTKTQGLLNLHVFRNKSYLFLCLNNFFFTFGLSIVYVHLSAYAASLGFSNDQGAFLFSALGISNFFGRIAFGFIAHVPCISPVSLYCIAFFITGAVTEFCPYFTSYAGLIVYAVVFGFMSASLGTLLPQIIVDILGVSMLTSGYGYVLIFEALGTLLGAPVAGWVYDYTSIYQTSLYLGGGVIMLSSLLMTYQWFCDPNTKSQKMEEIVEVYSDEVKEPMNV